MSEGRRNTPQHKAQYERIDAALRKGHAAAKVMVSFDDPTTIADQGSAVLYDEALREMEESLKDLHDAHFKLEQLDEVTK